MSSTGSTPTTHSSQANGTLRWRVVQHVLKIGTYSLPDQPQHIVGAGQSGGLAITESGEVATVAIMFTVDLAKGSGKHVLYAEHNFEDGSSYLTLGEGLTIASEDGKTARFEGTASFVRGSGRFNGITGNGSYTGRRLAALGENAETYLDYAMNYGLPSA